MIKAVTVFWKRPLSASIALNESQPSCRVLSGQTSPSPTAVPRAHRRETRTRTSARASRRAACSPDRLPQEPAVVPDAPRNESGVWEQSDSGQLQQRRLAAQGLSGLLSSPCFPCNKLCVRVRVGSPVYELAQKLQLELKLQVDKVSLPAYASRRLVWCKWRVLFCILRLKFFNK